MATCALGSPSCFNVVNASGSCFERALQAAVAQGLANRAFGGSVYLVGIEHFPGMAGIEFFPGSGCANCAGLRERWLATVEAARPHRVARRIGVDALLDLVRPLLAGGALYEASSPHSLGPVMTACGVHDLLPAASAESLPRGLEVRFDGRKRWADATAATWYTAKALLPLANATTLAIQAPTNLPFLADAVVAWRLPMLWMADMCRNATQHAALAYVLEEHFGDAPLVQYLGWFNNTHAPEPRTTLKSQCLPCSARH